MHEAIIFFWHTYLYSYLPTSSCKCKVHFAIVPHLGASLSHSLSLSLSLSHSLSLLVYRRSFYILVRCLAWGPVEWVSACVLMRGRWGGEQQGGGPMREQSHSSHPPISCTPHVLTHERLFKSHDWKKCQYLSGTLERSGPPAINLDHSKSYQSTQNLNFSSMK